MGKEVTLIEVSNLPVGGRDGEGVEQLSLELSLGGRYEEDSQTLRKEIENPFEGQLQNMEFGPRSDFYGVNGDDESTAELRRRRELQALRRLETRRKRGEAKAKALRFVVEGQRFHGRPSQETKLSKCPSLPSKAKSNGLLKKPPKPPSRSRTTTGLALPRVAVRGNGKTVMGFLCKYTAAEIVIRCDCHGASLSPAEFVEHTGGVNVTHPLRHITMVNT